MVFDTIENAARYYGLGTRFQQAFAWLQAADIDTMIHGQRIDIDGDYLYATYFDMDTLAQVEAKLEDHRAYADIQYLIAGCEQVGYATTHTARPISEYTPDIQFYEGHWDTLTLRAGNFYIVWPGDLHAPRLADGEISRVRRLVIKVQLSED